jgi:hypothetical protein
MADARRTTFCVSASSGELAEELLVASGPLAAGLAEV